MGVAVADPEFPPGERQLREGGVNLLFWSTFTSMLHDIEKNIGPPMTGISDVECLVS